MKFQSLKSTKVAILGYSKFIASWNLSKDSEENLSFIAFLSLKSFLSLQHQPDIFSKKNEWLVNIEEKRLKDLNFPFSSQVYSLNIDIDCTNIDIKEHYNIDQNIQVINTIGMWTHPGNLTLTTTIMWERRRDLRGFEFVAETMDQPPHAEYDVNEDGTVDRIQGIVGDLWHGILEQSMNFSTRISLPPDGKWGGLKEDGSWSGLVGGLIENRSQIAITSLYKTQGRSQVIEFAKPYAEDVVRIFIKYPQREASWTTFIGTFHPHVWLSLFILVVLLVICLYISHVFGPEKRMNEDSFNLSNAPIVVCGTLIGQGSFLDPKSISARIIILIGLLLGIITLFSFSGSLSSQLAIFHVTYPFVTLDGVIGSGYLIGAQEGGATMNGFLLSPEGSIRREIADKLIKPNPHTMVSGLKEGIGKMLNDKRFALMSTSEEIRYLSNDACQFMEIPYDIDTYNVGFGFPKHFPFLDIFNYFISKNIENGNLKRIKTKWFKEARSKCDGAAQLDSMGFDNVISAFFMIIGGVIITIGIFCAELCTANKQIVEVDQQEKTLDEI